MKYLETTRNPELPTTRHLSGTVFMRGGWVLAGLLITLYLMGMKTATAATFAELLEKGMYYEETVGDLKQAVTIYQTIVTDAKADRPLLAEARYRIALCTLKQGDKEKAHVLLREIIRDFPDQTKLVELIREQLREEPLKLIDVPWKDGELLVLTMYNPARAPLGKATWGAKKVTTDTPTGPKNLWRIESDISLTSNRNMQTTRVDADAETFAPVFAMTKSPLGLFEAVYEKESVKLTSTVQGNKNEHVADTKQHGTVYDNEQALYVLRRLPLQDRYYITFPIFTLQGAVVVECTIKVLGTETVTVAAGTYPCHQVSLSVQVQGITALEHKLWISTDANRYLVKYDSGAAVLELESVGMGPMPTPEASAAQGQSTQATNQLPAATANIPASPAEANKYAAKGWALWRERKLPEAEAQFRLAVAADATNANHWNGLGWALQNQGKLDAAAQAFGMCIQINPRHPAALNGMGWIAKVQGNEQQALGYWEQAIAASPNATAALNGLGQTYLELGQKQKAAQYFQQWLNVEPNNADAKEGLRKAQQ